MENVLKSLLQEKKEKEMIKLNAVEIVNALFNELQERERGYRLQPDELSAGLAEKPYNARGQGIQQAPRTENE